MEIETSDIIAIIEHCLDDGDAETAYAIYRTAAAGGMDTKLLRELISEAQDNAALHAAVLGIEGGVETVRLADFACHGHRGYTAVVRLMPQPGALRGQVASIDLAECATTDYEDLIDVVRKPLMEVVK